MNTRIQVDNATIARFWLILLAIVGSLVMIYWARKALLMIAVAAFLAVSLNPLVSSLSKKVFKNNRPFATAVVFIGILLTFVGFGFLVAPSLISQVKSFAETAPATIAHSVQALRDNETVQKLNLTPSVDEAVKFIETNKQKWTAQAGSIMFNGVNSIVGFVFSGVIVLTLTVLMLLDAPTIMQSFWRLYSDRKIMERHKIIAEKMAGTITGFVGGQLIQVTINGICAGVVVFILSLIFDTPTNLILPVGLLVSLMGLIPLVGTTIGGILGALLITFSNPTAGLTFMIYFVIYQQIENNIIAPYIQSRALNLSSLLVLIAVTVGIYLFGILGGIISIPLAACIKILIEENVDLAKI